MSRRLLRAARRRLRAHTPQLAPLADPNPLEATIDPVDRRIIEEARPYTITSAARMLALIDAVRYCHRRGIPGAFAECGVWLGGSVLVMIRALQDLGVEDRDIYLYDTFDGMTPPGEQDVSQFDRPALETWRAAQREGGVPWREYFDPDKFHEEAVRRTVLSTGYPEERLHFVSGPVEDTLPRSAPERLALLRLDTDWYASTRHEMDHLYPRLETGGVLVVDDYGHWEGARRAIDEYFSIVAPPLLLTRVDYTARVAVKL